MIPKLTMSQTVLSLLMLAVAPALVGAERPVGVTDPLFKMMPALREHGLRAVSPNGVLGDARGATEQEGQAVLAELAADLGAFLDTTRSASALG